MSKVAELLKEALKLDESERAELVDLLMLSIDDGATQEEIDASWAEEIKRRSDMLHSGQCELIDHEAAMAEARRRLAEFRA